MAQLTVGGSSKLRPSTVWWGWQGAAGPAHQASTIALFLISLGGPDPYLSALCLSGQAPTLHQWLGPPTSQVPLGLGTPGFLEDMAGKEQAIGSGLQVSCLGGWWGSAIQADRGRAVEA